MILLRRAVLGDAALLSAFERETFVETFGAANDPADMEQYLAEAFSPELQAEEIADPANTILLLEAEGALCGYAHLESGRAPSVVSGPSPIELKRFYIASAHHGQGLAQRLMEAVIDAARDKGAQTLWLGVWEHNPRAIAFYRKLGFTRVGEHTFLLGSDIQTDWLMHRAL